MKKIIALVVVLLLYLSGSWAIGYAAEKTLQSQAEQLSAYPGYQAELSDFRHGLFSSSALFTIGFDTDFLLADLPPEQAQNFGEVIRTMDEQGLAYRVDVSHGPLIFRNGFYAGLFKARFSLAEELAWAEALKAELGQDALVENELRMGYTGKGIGELRIQAIDSKGFQVGEGLVQYELASLGQNYHVTGEFQPSSYTDENGALKLGPLSFSASGELDPAAIGTGDFMLELASVVIEQGQAIVFELRDLSMRAENTAVDENTMDAIVHVELGYLDTFEMDPPVSRLLFEGGMLNLDRDGFAQFYQQSLEARGLQDPMQEQLASLNAMASLMKGNPRLVIRELSYEQGPDITFDLSSSLGLGADPSSNPAILQNPFMLLGLLELELEMAFSQAFLDMTMERYVDGQLAGIDLPASSVAQMRAQQLRQTATMVQQMIQMGYLNFDAGSYSLSATFNQGQMLVNGSAVPLPFF